MQKAAINIAEALKKPTTIIETELAYEPNDLVLYGRQLVPVGSIRLKLSYGYDGENGVNMAGVVAAVFREECSRCGKEISLPFECEFNELFLRRGSKGMADEDTEAYAFSGEVIELSEFIDELILLNYPITCLCSEECAGLCPICGCDLNENVCECNVERQNQIDMEADDAFEKAMELLKSRYPNNK